MIFVVAVSALGGNIGGIEDEKMSNFFIGLAVGKEMNGGMETSKLCRDEG